MNTNNALIRQLFLLLTFALIGLQGDRSWAQEVVAPKDRKGKVSYALGWQVGQNLMKKDLAVDPDALALGIKDGLDGKESRLSEQEIKQAQREHSAAREEKRRGLAEKNRVEGEAFLRENAKKEGVYTLPSGLQYRVLQPGTGKSPTPESNVKLHYVARSIDGSVVDSSYKRGEPTVLPVVDSMPAFFDALLLMKEGAKWELFAPGHLAYGEQGVENTVGPNQLLIFELELISIE